MVLSEDASLFTWSDTPITATTETRTPASYDDGEEAGSITWTTGPNSVTAGVEVEGSITPPDGWWRLTHPAELLAR
jgi:D-alanyl-D-alanine carboxypeptidase (penicillin-binding protein 5/6)